MNFEDILVGDEFIDKNHNIRKVIFKIKEAKEIVATLSLINPHFGTTSINGKIYTEKDLYKLGSLANRKVKFATC